MHKQEQMTAGHLITEELGICRHKHRRQLEITGRKSNQQGRKTAQTVAKKPPTRFLRKAVDKPPYSFAGVGNDCGTDPEEDKGGTKELTES